MRSPIKKIIDVAIIMGSDSDLPVMKEAAQVLEEFDIVFAIAILSAHRTPDALHKYIEQVTNKGVKIFIAGAGGAAHLAGVIAAQVMVPVIGVPIKTPTLGGVDSLYSIVQMPPGVPVATVGINGGKNAALLALQMLSLNDERVKKKFSDYRRAMADSVVAKNKKLKNIGYKSYLKNVKPV